MSEIITRADGLPYRILVAEDKDLNQVMAMKLFEMLGCQVELAKDGEQALKMAIANEYDAIFMDCDMPIMDGYEATMKIRRYEDASQIVHGRTPIIALTAKVMANDREKCIECGMDDYLTKPIEKSAIIKALNKWCRRAIDAKSDW